MLFSRLITFKESPFDLKEMESVWDDESPNSRFMRRLIRERAIEWMQDPTFLKSVRFRNEEAKRMQKRFGAVWSEFGTDIYKLIAKAYGEAWDAEDEEKHAPAVATEKKVSAINQNARNDDLVTTRKKGTRSGLDHFQGIFEASVCVVEEEEEGRRLRKRREESSRARSRSGSCCAEEEEAPPQKESSSSRGRREDFYQRAGGSC